MALAMVMIVIIRLCRNIGGAGVGATVSAFAVFVRAVVAGGGADDDVALLHSIIIVVIAAAIRAGHVAVLAMLRVLVQIKFPR